MGEVFVFIKQTFSFHRLVILRLQFHVRQIENVEKPEKKSSGLRCMGNSPGDETDSSMIHVFDEAGSVIETHEHAGDFQEL